MTAPFVYDGAINGTVFLASVAQVLAPTLSPGDVVIMDNLPARGGGRSDRHRGSGGEPLLLVALFTQLQPY